MKKKVLIIDDDPTIHKAFVLALEDADCEVEIATSGEAGIEKVKQDNIGLIFLDLRMPNMNGIETLLTIRALDQNVPIYIVTAFYKEYFSDLQQTAKQGISFDLLNKPVSSDQINQVVEKLLK